jgi:hypothetical protein
MDASIATAQAIAAYIGIDWAEQKHAVGLRSTAERSKIEHQLIDQKPEALMEGSASWNNALVLRAKT